MREGKKIIYVIGVFDLFHIGHTRMLKKAKELGDVLIVAINSDRLVSIYKRAPIFSQNDRLEILQACKYVDEVFVVDTFDHKEILRNKMVDVIVHGNDWEKESYMKQICVDDEFLELNRIRLRFTNYTRSVSTSELIKKIKEAE